MLVGLRFVRTKDTAHCGLALTVGIRRALGRLGPMGFCAAMMTTMKTMNARTAQCLLLGSMVQMCIGLARKATAGCRLQVASDSFVSFCDSFTSMGCEGELSSEQSRDLA